MAEDDKEDGINITLGKMIAYPIGILLLLSGVAGLITSPLGGILLLLAGGLALPITRARLKDQTGIGINRWAASAIVLILIVSGGALLPSDSGGSLDTGDSNGGEIIEQEASELTPSIDDFEDGWREVENQNGTADFVSPEASERVIYEITVYDSVEEAQSAVDSEEPDSVSTDDSGVGDGGFKYKVADKNYQITFHERNVVCSMEYGGDITVYSAESNAESFAETCSQSIQE